MRRIMPEEVIEAYEVTELRPCTSAFYIESLGAACALTATAYHRNPDMDLNGSAGHVGTHLTLRIPLDYVWGFTSGFDTPKELSSPRESDNFLERIGRIDGEAARDAVLDRYGPLVIHD